MSNAKEFDFQDFNDIMVGAHFYACGGGGSLKNGLQLIEQTEEILKKRGSNHLEYLSADEVADDNWLPVLGAMGAPQKFLDDGYGKSPYKAFCAHEKLIQHRLGDPDLSFCSAIAAETGTIAHGMALLVAAQANLPIINGDGGGRAVPSLQMLSMSNPDNDYGILISPCSLVSENAVSDGGAHLNFECNNPSAVDKIIRGIISAGAGFDERASFSCFAMKGHQLKQPGVLVHNTLTRARDLGKAIREANKNAHDPLDVIKSLPTANLLTQGHITNVESVTRGGFDWVNIYITDDNKENEFIVIAKNENLIVWSQKDSSPVAMAPDLICYIQPDGTVLSNSEIVTNFNKNNPIPIALFALDAPKELMSEWSHQQFSKVLKNCGYYGSYHKPLKN